MKTKNNVFALCLCIALSLTFSCSKEQANDLPQEENLTFEQKLELYGETNSNLPQRAPVTYVGELCDEVVQGTVNSGQSIGNPAGWNYYSFVGNAGDNITIQVNRLDDGMDAAFSLFEGTTNDSDGVNFLNGGANMTFLDFGDDEIPHPGCFGDPYSAIVLPSTGSYTLAVYYWANCGTTPYDYEIVTTGISCDADGDGCNDNVDPHPNSDVRNKVRINGCNSRVPNVFVTQCSTMNDLIQDCMDNASNTGAFLHCLGQLTNDWVHDGLITAGQKAKILRCAFNF
ncbi:hypothetical protein [Altibacter sp.]|uniref:hypothetical protein n=1 Tax=Altibacter sp. TaxID=2024823 RepID=UPI0025843FD3|nr:hypothetical protein [Altibacter sp.]MCW9037620.1 hypothetical protein [Altibacter sp.]